jgi:aspartyl protease family protein
MSSGNVLAFAGATLLGVAFVAPSLKSGGSTPVGERPFAAAASPVKQPGIGNGLSSRELLRAPDGHFYADVQVNNVTIRFMVDTGASVVMLTPADAQRAGIALPAQRELAMGVGGTVSVAPVTIDRLAIGPLEARYVQGAVAEQLPISLLGQNVLARIGSVEIRGDRMVLR